MVTVAASLVTSVFTLASIDTVVIASVGAAVVAFVASSFCFSVVSLAVLGCSIRVLIFSLNSVICTGETVLSATFSVRVAVEVSSTTMSVVGLAVLRTSAFGMASVRGSVKTATVSLVAVFTGSPVITPRVTLTDVPMVSASVTTDVVDGSLVSTIDGAVVSGVAVSVNGSVDASVLDLMVTVEKSFVTFVSTFSSTGKCVAVSASAAVGDDFVVSTTCFPVVSRTVVESLTSFVTFRLA